MTDEEKDRLIAQLVEGQEKHSELIRYLFVVLNSHTHTFWTGDMVRHPDIESAIEYKAFIESEGLKIL